MWDVTLAWFVLRVGGSLQWVVVELKVVLCAGAPAAK